MTAQHWGSNGTPLTDVKTDKNKTNPKSYYNKNI